MLCMRTRSFARANDVKIVHSRDGQCNTEESGSLSINSIVKKEMNYLFQLWV